MTLASGRNSAEKTGNDPRQPCAELGLVSAVDDGEIQPRQPLGKRRAERSGRHQPAIPDTEAAVKDPDGHAVRQIGVLHAVIPVSYTHLTLPTILLV